MKKLLFTVLIVLSGSACSVTSKIDRTLQFSEKQTMALYHSVKDMEGRLPRSIDKNGKLVTSDDAWWCSGFTAGTLWYLYEYSKCDSLKL
ncbi:hypothetical protein EZS27_033172 [termite gut metagenome]|uniref:Uncharacterized protein n=1 Tax=termite gut metagenome TaxID=433724 RepID=A0A5J4Q6B6_9ZZZZ